VTPWWWREPGRGNYVRLEREWRWLLRRVPSDAGDPVAVVDRYITGSTLRLRHLHADTGDVYKLTQKVRIEMPGAVAVTNVYLTVDEYAVLCRLPAMELTKTRRRWTVGGLGCVVDELTGRWEGIVLAELEHEGNAPMPDLPDAVDVTLDDRFTGGMLATTVQADVASVHEAVRALVNA